MDHVLCDFTPKYIEYQKRHPDLAFPYSVPGFFLDLDPIPGAVQAFRWLMEHEHYKPYILTAPSVRNAHCYSEKRLWVERHLGFDAAYRLIITPDKSLNIGGYLIDDNIQGKGQDAFQGQLIHFGSERFPGWDSVLAYLRSEQKSHRENS
jgi:5'-nucleotidase